MKRGDYHRSRSNEVDEADIANGHSQTLAESQQISSTQQASIPNDSRVPQPAAAAHDDEPRIAVKRERNSKAKDGFDGGNGHHESYSPTTLGEALYDELDLLDKESCRLKVLLATYLQQQNSILRKMFGQFSSA